LAPEQEQLRLGQQERDRLKVLHEVEQGHLKQREAAVQLGMSERGFRKLLKRYRSQGDRAVVHGLKGRSSKRRLIGGRWRERFGWCVRSTAISVRRWRAST
jgi:predicted DNA-binding protein (UPF0251 family)